MESEKFTKFLSVSSFQPAFFLLLMENFSHFIAENFSAYFNVTSFEEGKSITLATDSLFLFRSSFSITFRGMFGCQSSSALQIRHHFSIKSMLFHRTIGPVLQKLLEQRLAESLSNLKVALCKLRAERFLL